MYNADKINAAIHSAQKTRKLCRQIAAQYAPVPLPESCIAKICTRRKLYNYLEALDLEHASIQAIFWQYDLSVPRDHSLRPSTAIDHDARPAWLDGAPLDMPDTYTDSAEFDWL